MWIKKYSFYVYIDFVPFLCVSVVWLTVSLTLNGQSAVPGSCLFTNNDTCGYNLGASWSVHRGEYFFHRPVISYGSGKAL